MPVLRSHDFIRKHRTAIKVFALILLLLSPFVCLTIYEARQLKLDKALVAAVEQENVSEVHKLLHSGASANATEAVPSQSLFDILKAIVLRGQTRKGRTMLQVAVNENNADIAEALLDKGADANVRDDLDQTLLFWMAGRGSVRMVKALLRHGARVNDRGYGEWTALTAAKFGRRWIGAGPHDEIITLLEKAGAHE